MAHQPDIVRGQVRQTGYRRLSHGLYVALAPGLVGRDRLLHDLKAHTHVLPEGAGFTHLTAAWLRGWALPQLPVLTPVFASGPTAAQPRRSGLVYSRLLRLDPPTTVEDLPVVCPGETLLRAARDLGLLDLVVMIDSALHLRHVDAASLAPQIDSSRPGARRLRVALSWADRRTESPFESLLRLFHEFAGIPVEPQLDVYDADGIFVARSDLWVKGTNLLHEYDGEGHARRDQRVRDSRRQRRFAGTPFTRQGFLAEDLFVNPLTTLQEIDRTLGRRHRASRLARWRHELALSSYSTVGRQRLLNRWLAYPGVNDCAKTA